MTHNELMLDAYAHCRMLGFDSMLKMLNNCIKDGITTESDAEKIAEEVRERIDSEFPKGHNFF